ncbi:hypothetical protein AALP_AA6G228100 [Arabis alpina]|uniref:Uncharacterized protein n=1 Tax=Arabis alpina TaxID=50452 RepID=A0A087GR29_ARAAL|nr:hypothetical protein AALP_AA6G228100 [Arabis alpina]
MLETTKLFKGLKFCRVFGDVDPICWGLKYTYGSDCHKITNKNKKMTLYICRESFKEIDMSGLAQGTSTHVSLISMDAYAKSSSCFRRNKENFTMPGSPMGKMEEVVA